MKTIDAKGTFNCKQLAEFMSNVADTDDIGIFAPNHQQLTHKPDFFKDFWNIPDSKEPGEITMMCGETVIIFTVADYMWWKKTTKRQNKLENYASEGTQVSSKLIKSSSVIPTRSVAVGILQDDGYIVDIESTTAPESELTGWLNSRIRELTIRHYYKQQVMLCLDYHDDAENDKWYSFDEIVTLNMIQDSARQG